MRRLVKLFVVVSLCALALTAASAEARVLLGVHGDMTRFRTQTGQRSDGRLVFFGWNQGYTWGRRFDAWFPRLGTHPIVSLNTGLRSGGQMTPKAIAMGRGDRYLIALSRAIYRWGRPVYIRPFAEMNGYWNRYSAYNRNGTRRDAAHSTLNFRRAFRRVYLILHGGDRAAINTVLVRNNMPRIRVDLAENPKPTLKVIWNPMANGDPYVPGNRPAAYFPGNAFVDVVGNDVYDIGTGGAWDANLRLFNAYRTKPYALGEFGMFGRDNPTFIRRAATFIRTHRRVELAIFYESKRGSIFDLGSKPRSRAAYRSSIAPLNR